MKLSRYLAVCLVNCDFSGCTDDDMKVIDKIDFDFNVTDWAEESSDINYRCDFSYKWDHCVTIEEC